MRSGMLLALLAIFVLHTGAWAGSPRSGAGLGVLLGEPTGLSGKLWLSSENAVAMGLAGSRGHDGHRHLHLDYLWRNLNIFNPGIDDIPMHYGLGVQLETREVGDDHVGLRMPFGFSYWRAGAAYELFGEVVPVFEVSPNSDWKIQLAVGARYYF